MKRCILCVLGHGPLISVCYLSVRFHLSLICVLLCSCDDDFVCLSLSAVIDSRDFWEVVLRQRYCMLICSVKGVSQIHLKTVTLPAEPVLDVRIREHLAVEEVASGYSDQMGGPFV